ncbi:unnamed protein product [Phytophthora fragariaefolia]|uniref:Unnamed protein product n=1 Tax=Phytophthora fragariaefolia TaxID=1490495 RepID=A0A9W7CXH6_9STRA|nr:unnamed protein product [Phytophthora fragariaefolia]
MESMRKHEVQYIDRRSNDGGEQDASHAVQVPRGSELNSGRQRDDPHDDLHDSHGNVEKNEHESSDGHQSASNKLHGDCHDDNGHDYSGHDAKGHNGDEYDCLGDRPRSMEILANKYANRDEATITTGSSDATSVREGQSRNDFFNWKGSCTGS